MKIVVLDGYALNPGDLSWDALRALGETTVYDYTAPQDTISRIAGAQIVLTNKTILGEKELASSSTLRYVGVLATGYNVVDIAEADRRGIVVTNVPAYSTDAVAQYVFALLLELCCHVGHHDQAVQQGRWAANRDFCFWDYPLTELAGKTMGVIGYGRIGRATANIARAFGMRVLATGSKPGDGLVPLDTLLAESDVISLHCPLTATNAGLIGREALAKMKPGAILINTARGPLVDEAALRDALTSGHLAGAAVDVVSKEPIAADNPLLGAPNCIITPHIAWASKEARQRLMDIAVNNVKCFMDGAPVNAVHA